MKKKVLVVEDDEFFRLAVKSILGNNYEVLEASNGKIAQDLIATSSPDLVLSDIQMPHLSGVDLLAWIKKTKPVPVILMTGFAQIVETKKAHDLGADDFLAKPFKDTELLEKISRILGESPASKVATKAVDLDAEFCKLALEDFISAREADYPVYIRISESKYIKIAHQGGKLPPDKVALLKEKGLLYLYVRHEDFAKVVGFTIQFSKAVSDSEQVQKAKKMRFMKYTGELIAQQAFVAGADEQLFRNAKDFLTASMDLITEDPATFSLLDQLSTHTDYLYSHSLGVSVFAVMIAKQMGWQAPQTLFKISFAGLFHDIGKKEIPKEILEKPRALLSIEERKLIESHASRSKEILESLNTAPTEVIQAAYEHHEDILGQGYPRGINKVKIHPMALIIAVANTFCNYTISNPQHKEPLKALDALEMMLQLKSASLDPNCFAALARTLSVKKSAV
jgi:putative nucleotidyltransferase with HDIG domain